MLNSSELQELYQGLKLNAVNKYDYVLTGEAPRLGQALTSPPQTCHVVGRGRCWDAACRKV